MRTKVNGRCLTNLWPDKGRFCSQLQSKVADCGADFSGRLAAVRCSLGVVVPPENVSIYRFGVFELDLRAAELRKSGVKLRLQEQPRQVLLKLLERHGELVTREELRSGLWHEDTFVDFENGLNTAIKRLRETLGDSADNAIFIETIPRRGYKFIAPVEALLSQGPEDNAKPGLVQPQGTPQRKRLTKRRYLVGVVAVLLLVGAALRYMQPHPPTVANVVRITNDGKAKLTMNLPVTDGAHLYFIEGGTYTTGSGIAQMSVAGGETTWITTTLPNILAIYAISPDHSELLVASGTAVGADPETGRSDFASEVWVQPLPAGSPRRIPNMYATAACWTPDGARIIYADGHAVLIANKDGSEPHELAKVPGVVRLLRFSPDGRRIRFSLIHHGAEGNTIWEMAADGTDVHPLFPDWKESPYQSSGNWSPDGDLYYFHAGRGSTQAIWVLPENRSFFRRGGGTPSLLLSGPLRFSAAVPSGDGKKLFVVGEEPRVELFRYDSAARRFDSYLPGLSAGPVGFSSDRKWIAYVSYPDMTLWRSRPDGTEKMQLTFPPVRAYEPRWSPDGSQIVFLDSQFNVPWKIRILSSSGSSPELLIRRGTDAAESDPTWSPDGKSIVFAKSSETPKIPVAIYRLDLQTGNVSTIPGSVGLFSPRLSYDGHFICALTEAPKKLMLFDTVTNHWSTLAEGNLFGYNEWSHDGKYIYLRETHGGAGELVRVRTKDGALERLISLKDFPQLIDMFAAWIGLTPDDAPLLMRDRSVQEIYALELRFR
jgi:Tol biopolymer transport system component/DNA-binding winged helix-turn-helix (wHTH) protein